MVFDVLSAVLRGVPMTLLLTGAGLGIGMLGGIPLVAARVSPRPAFRMLARSVIEVVRGIPPLVWLFILYFGLGSALPQIEPLQAAIIGFGVISSAYMAEIYRGALAAVHAGQWEASTALGMSRVATARRIVGPQVLRISVPATATYGIGLLKDSSMAYTLGLEETLFQANQQSQLTGEAIMPFAVAGFVYIVMSAVLATFARYIDNRLRKRIAR